MEHIDFINVSPIQCFDNRQDTTTYKKSTTWMEKDKGQEAIILNIVASKNRLAGEKPDGTIIRVPVVLADLTLVFNSSSTWAIGSEPIRVGDIRREIILDESILVETSKVIYLKGRLIAKLEYSKTSCLDNGMESSKLCYKTAESAFNYAYQVDFHTNPQEVIEMNLNNQIDGRYFNNKINCNLISSKISAGDLQVDNSSQVKSLSQEVLVELGIELVQNQRIIIAGEK